jgi:hypothetical protein
MTPTTQATRPTCAGCGSTRLHEVKCNPPHHARLDCLDCLDCGRRGSFKPSPWSLDRARAFMMPFGKFKGRTIGELAKNNQGRSYLKWAAENLDGNAGMAAAIVLRGVAT